jgi:hypothetical protein
MGVEVRRAALRLLALAALAFAGDRLLASAGSAALHSSELRFSVAARGDLAAEVLVLGDSRAVNSFWTPELERVSGRPAFSLAFNGVRSRPRPRCLPRPQRAPRLILLEVTNVRDNHDPEGARAYWPTSPSSVRTSLPRSPPRRVASSR